MVVKHNITAMNSNRMLSVTSKAQSKATEKLSSGYRINRAADDAAGLSISEKMRKQIRGLTQASSNAQDGISAVQTAEGALTEVHDMLQRMNELAVKSANGTNSKDDRKYIQAEVDQLVTEIDRVALTTKFNETYLLKGTDSDGNAGKLTFMDATRVFNKLATSSYFDDDGKLKETIKGPNAYKYKNNTDNANKIVAMMNLTNIAMKSDDTSVEAKVFSIGRNEYGVIMNFQPGAGETRTLQDIVDNFDGDINSYKIDSERLASSLEELAEIVKEDYKGAFKEVSFSVAADGNVLMSAVAFADVNSDLKFNLHVGADSSKDNKISVNIKAMSARSLGINGVKVNGSDDTKATEAIDTIAKAIRTVSAQRSSLGAVQNRLEHTINNLDNVVENTTSAESAIRDTDMATQMVDYSNNRILAQAGQAMLAQANQSNQGVLALLG